MISRSPLELSFSHIVSDPFDPARFIFNFLDSFNYPDFLSSRPDAFDVSSSHQNFIIFRHKLLMRVAHLGEAERVFEETISLSYSRPRLRFIFVTDGKVVYFRDLLSGYITTFDLIDLPEYAPMLSVLSTL